MRVSCLSLLLAAAVAPAAVHAEVLFSTLAGKSFTGGRTFTVSWKDDGNEPKLVVNNAFTLDLCTGSNSDIYPLTTLVAGQTFLGAQGTASVNVLPGIAGNGASYFLRMTWTAAEGTVVNYSQRFAMTGMVGVFTPPQIQANAVGDTTPPKAEHPVRPLVLDPEGGQYAVPYNQQSGDVRYAPMQPRPGSVITANKMKRLNPTSAYTVFTTKGPAPGVTTTVTQPMTYALTTVVNEAEPAPMPDDDMARFLNRWKD
ncbi:hypothetical protein DRE_06741 [Drechslerella stenobrocha 248]|uniref:Uncharacterized protein n=1 Tax=Drechslerella stenobrocha 248 TaxID=1043628 RepID=W7HX44_9PEZI|nr:hypothetical protein DRE_06741 [Drechslerella stenobrocha 248]